VKLSIEQEIELEAKKHRYRTKYTLAQTHCHGVAAREAEQAVREMSLDLSTIKYNIPHEHKKKGEMKPLSDADICIGSQMQPACNGSIIKNHYFLTIRCDFEGCTCCSSLPATKIPMQVVPYVYENLFNFPRPADFNPVVYDAYAFDISQPQAMV